MVPMTWPPGMPKTLMPRMSGRTRRLTPGDGSGALRFNFIGGEIVKMVFDIADDAYIDVERHFAAAMARD